MKIQLFALLLIPLLLLGACSNEPSGDLKEFKNAQELQAYIEANTNSGNDNYYARGGIATFDMAMEESAMATNTVRVDAAPQATSGDGNTKVGAGEYSTTNNQVQNVDEADIVKNDGKYIYTLSGQTLAIVDAYPAEQAKIVSTIAIKGTPRELLLENNTLIVIAQDYAEELYWPEYSIMPVPRSKQITKAYTYDISDKENPQLQETIQASGDYKQSRRIDDKIYLITHEGVYYGGPGIPMPFVRSGATTIEPRMFYFDNPQDDYQFTTVTSFTTQGEVLSAQSYLMGYANTVYVSQNNIYIAQQKNEPWENKQRERFVDVVLPLLPEDLQQELAGEDEWDAMARVLEEYVNTLDKRESQKLYERIEEAIYEYEVKQAIERSKTIIHRIAIDDGEVEYQEKGEVPGHLLNQFSLDEFEGNLRVATTTQGWFNSGQIQYNNVYVLDDDLDIIGEIEEIAPDERIYSTRFIGEKLYMVTFRQTDPFFVIDLSDARNPEILGELKIPGWSGYLHPYDETHVIGIGKETKENEWGGVTTLGVKVSLYDVSDVTNPVEVDTFEVGLSGSDSIAINEHKAFLFDKEKELLVLPIREVRRESSWTNGRYYNQDVWQGAYVLNINTNGFSKRGIITHYTGDEENYWSWWGSTSAVKRSLYMDDVLYTISLEQIQMHTLADVDFINKIALPFEEELPEPRPYYYGDDMVMEATVSQGASEPMPPVAVESDNK